MTPQQQIDEYLSHFESHLRTTTTREKEDILWEIRAHIRDSAEQSGDVAAVLGRLGEPGALAEQYRDSVVFTSASRSISPLVLLGAGLRLATKGLFGAFVFFCGVFGYSFGVGLVLVGFIKPLAPAHTGLWLQDGVLVSSGALMRIPPPPAHEMLGWYIIPITLTVGTLILLVTTFTIRFGLKLSHSWQARCEGLTMIGPMQL